MSIIVRYRPDEEIEAEACDILAGYARKTGTVITVPALILDDLLQNLGLRLESYDLCKEFGAPDVLGAIYLEKKLIRIDERLDADERPAMRGRFNFTLAHEIGHWCLHRGDAETRQTMGDLFGGPAQPSIICRTSQQKERVEIQADLFASCLLMPRTPLANAWKQRIGREHIDLGSLRSRWQELCAAASLQQSGGRLTGREQKDRVIEILVGPLAGDFHVSAQAMRIRLERLGWIVRDVDEQESLFGAT
jgi:Zn-dependent peptidase ImmA (M78 family)